MTKDILILGLGKFGGQLAKALNEKGVRVHGVDCEETLAAHNDHLYAKASVDLTTLDCEKAVQDLFSEFDANFSAAVVSLGSQEALATSTAMALSDIRELPHVLVKAVDAMHESVLLRLAESSTNRFEVIIPERFAATRKATSLADDGIEEDVRINDLVGIREIHCPASLVGKSLRDSGLRDDRQLNVVAVRF
ncbi:MAG: TrkA family potassium uptake protein, partial [Planctomycetes bacterium]|nr:TrkA family potassium uptake protein [Planctomycetota bacterium]